MKKLALNLVLSVFVLVLPVLASDLPGSLEGQWTLVHQTYGEGERNLAGLDRPVQLEILLSRGAPQVMIWAGADKASALSWPAWTAETDSRSLVLMERTLDPAAGLLRARYRIPPANSKDNFVLEIEENYKIMQEGTVDVMVGKLIVQFIREGKPQGSYVLHRRFERVAP
jgi:hypothetical protein